MKISNEQWDEWLSAIITDTVSAESELSGIISCMRIHAEENSIKATSPRLWVFRRFRRLWPCVSWSKEAELNEILRVRSRTVSLELPLNLYREIIEKPAQADFIRWAWARGVFGCTGGIYNPKRGYYCIMRFHSQQTAQSMTQLLEGSEVSCFARDTSGVREVTIRDLQQIIRFCYFMGLSAVAQNLEERAIVRSTRDLANKQANCDSANIKRSIETARQHIAFISFLRDLDAALIPKNLVPLAKLRLNHPEATLSELGDMLRPQVSKSTVKYRMKKLQNIAEEAGFHA
ncbi:MAG: DNA-binding protein WhiA [Pyramidobacter sp.]|nr:DNA-binding protein WhiA [Pyramidobacter sp.]